MLFWEVPLGSKSKLTFRRKIDSGIDQKGGSPMFEFNKDNFEDEVLKSEIPVLIDYWNPG